MRVSSAVYPRVGGATPSLSPPRRICRGLSPRGRGNPGRINPANGPERSIPAWAGQPAWAISVPWWKWVYPRVGGATNSGRRLAPTTCGLSPRGRGNRGGGLGAHLSRRSIPAWAGQPFPSTATVEDVRVYPRVGGATKLPSQVEVTRDGLSPRGRGNLLPSGLAASYLGSIPAWAGQPAMGGAPGLTELVYPRVGGATALPGGTPLATFGLSPRGRGNLVGDAIAGVACRSIPAWAGQPGSREDRGPAGSVYPRVGGATDHPI